MFNIQFAIKYNHYLHFNDIPVLALNDPVKNHQVNYCCPARALFFSLKDRYNAEDLIHSFCQPADQESFYSADDGLTDIPHRL